MAGQLFLTQRSISQVVRRHTPGSLLYIDEHNLTARVTRVNGERDVQVDPTRLHAQVVRFLQSWENKSGRLSGISSDIELRDLLPIAPQSVSWEPYPHMYRCIKEDCQVLHDGTAQNFTGRCRRYGGALRQLPYVSYHRCGSFGYLRPPQFAQCPTHGMAQLYFHDTRRFQTSSWRCRAENCQHEVKFQFMRCGNAECRAEDPQHTGLQWSFWNDQWVHYGQSLNYINLDEQLARRFLETPRGKSVLHAGVLGAIPAGGKRLLRTLETEGATCPSCGFTVPHGSRFCNRCGTPIPGAESADGALPGAEYPASSESGRCAWSLLRDIESSRSLRDEAGRRASEGAGDDDAYRWGMRHAAAAGVADVVLVTEFPLTTAAVGYTRDRSGPPAWLRAFERVEERWPIYTHTVETEAWLIQLRAGVIARWLIDNGVEPFASALRDIEPSEDALKEWFIARLARLEAVPSPDDVYLQKVLFGLLHTFAHVTLLSLATQAGLEASSLGELVLTDALGFAIYAGESELGALTAAFEQLAGIVFANAVQDYASCKLDPTCRHDDGGTCVGCIQLPRGCQVFNDRLSRAYLYGGATGGQAPTEVARGYFASAARLC